MVQKTPKGNRLPDTTLRAMIVVVVFVAWTLSLGVVMGAKIFPVPIPWAKDVFLLTTALIVGEILLQATRAANNQSDLAELWAAKNRQQDQITTLLGEVKGVVAAFRHMNIEEARTSVRLLHEAYARAKELQGIALDSQTKMAASGILQDVVAILQKLNAEHPDREAVAEMTAATGSKITKLAS